MGEVIYEQKEVSWSLRGEVISLVRNVEVALCSLVFFLFLSLWETMASASHSAGSSLLSFSCPASLWFWRREHALLPLWNFITLLFKPATYLDL